MYVDINLNKLDLYMTMIKLVLINIFTYFIALKIINTIEKRNKNTYELIYIFICTIFILYIRYKISYTISIVIQLILLSFIIAKHTYEKIEYSIFIVLISLSINYILFFIGVSVSFLVNTVTKINNDYFNLLIIFVTELVLMHFIKKIKRIEYGISFLKSKENNDLFNIITLNIATMLVYTFIIVANAADNSQITRKLTIYFIIISIIMFLTIKKSIEAYYKQKLLIQDLSETKKELEDKKKEVEELEAENLRFSKKAHSLAHKQKSLEFKINKILINSEIAEEIGIESELKNISKQLLENAKLPKLDKTGIYEIDDMFDVMQEECRLNGIDFVLQLKGNIYQMINHHITKDELAVLLADHIKDAIIAINHSDNLNKSIMVRLGKIEECFAVYFYDSGVEFPKKVFDSLGKKAITTYLNEGGTGMGFMNTFDLLNKYSASLIIENIGKPSKDNYTKIIKIIFDNKNNILFNNSFFDNK